MSGMRGDHIQRPVSADAFRFGHVQGHRPGRGALSGDQRRYDKKTGTWARTNPIENAYYFRQHGEPMCCGHGAVQLVARYTFLDLVSGDPILTPTSGGAREQQDVTLGVNWYINSQMWFMLNYVATRIDSVTPGADGDIHGVGCRLHLDF